MKKKLLGGIVAVVIAAVAAINVNINNEAENGLSAFSLANVEALALNENSGNCQRNCKVKLNYLCITTNGDRHGYICAD
ncbi:NVEALA domain-containing protein [Sphingobacterium gobiense]|uniref:NVEALA protein n=1 Tax=Sphingobacterium gobiense TaxID=1382456 RepID=A0A2S9JU10_9SPHI|nr:NVEALA domain-containing protein [Sphingobacterium gobiense]PRD56766.1 hypothetical protein C5749_05935 [Sphingobacterium gobiense]